MTQGFKELRGVAKDLKGELHLTRYLGSFFVMSMAIQTIMLMATSFGIKEVELTTAELIVATLLVQVVAIPAHFLWRGAVANSAMSKPLGDAFWRGAPCAFTPIGLHPAKKDSTWRRASLAS